MSTIKDSSACPLTRTIRSEVPAVRLHGAKGCTTEYPVGRYLRDATVMGIVEGTHEIHQVSLANYAFQRPYLD